jgi:hypothetical protein
MPPTRGLTRLAPRPNNPKREVRRHLSGNASVTTATYVRGTLARLVAGDRITANALFGRYPNQRKRREVRRNE